MNQVSLIIPFYNEATKFERFRSILISYLKHNRLLGELILVNDGSTDGTGQLLDTLAKSIDFPVRVIHVSPNKGKGHAIKTGVQQAQYPWILFNDADFSYLPDQLEAWVNDGRLDLNSEQRACFGSREEGAKLGWVTFKWHRRIIGRVYAWLIRLVTGITVTDTQCGFKLFPAPLAKQVFAQVQEERFAFDVEIHYLLKQWGLPPRMLPVRCVEFGDSKVDLIRDSWQMAKALWQIKKRHRVG